MLIDRYIDYILSIRRYSDRTGKIYRDCLECFTLFINGDKTVSDGELITSMTQNCIRNYEVFLIDQKKIDERTVNLHLSVMSGFCRYLIKEGLLTNNPVRTVKRPKPARRLPEFYRENSIVEYFRSTEHYVDAEALNFLKVLAAEAENDKTAEEWYYARLRRLIVSLLFNTGMRRSELLGLERRSVDFGRNLIIVKGKGDKMREIPLIDCLRNEICLYLDAVDSMAVMPDAPQRPLLVDIKGSALYPVFVDRAVKRELGDIKSITGKKSPHVLRHTIATDLLNNGTDINSIKKLLGHSSLAATQVYTHNSIEKLKKVYQTAHPRAKRGGNNGD